MATKPIKSVIQIIGTTGVGKSQLGIELAKRLNGEIINSDSMQIYQGLDIITNKHPIDKRDGVPHHLLGFLNNREEYRISTYEKDATTIIENLHRNGKLPIVVGGTAYYSTALVFQDMLAESSLPQLAEARDTDARLEKPTAELYKDLEEIDPVMATRWHPKDHRKIRRSLEIFYQSGKRQSELYSEQRESGRLGPNNVKYRTLFLWLWSDQEVLDGRLDARVDEMMSLGLFEEIKGMYALQDKDSVPDFTRGIYQTIGYKEFLKYLETGEEAEKLAGTDRMKTATRRYARRQIKWIRNKLLLQCREAGDDVQVVLLDASDLTQWDALVRDKGLAAVQDFISSKAPYNPLAYSGPAQHALLVPKQEKEFSANPEAWKKFVCDICPKFTCNTDADWKQHLASNGHKAKVRQAQKRKDFQKWKKAQSVPTLDRSSSDQSNQSSSSGLSLIGSSTSSPGINNANG